MGGRAVGKRKGDWLMERVTETDMPTGCFVRHWKNMNIKLQMQ